MVIRVASGQGKGLTKHLGRKASGLNARLTNTTQLPTRALESPACSRPGAPDPFVLNAAGTSRTTGAGKLNQHSTRARSAVHASVQFQPAEPAWSNSFEAAPVVPNGSRLAHGGDAIHMADLGTTLNTHQLQKPRQNTKNRRATKKRCKSYTSAASSHLPPFSHQVDLSDLDDPSSPSAASSSSHSPSLPRNFHNTVLLLTLILVAGNLYPLLRSFAPSILSPPTSLFRGTSRKPPTPSSKVSSTAGQVPTLPSEPPPPSDFATAQVRVVAIVPRSAESPLGGTPWGEVMPHLASRFSWTDPEYSMKVLFAEDLAQPGPRQASAQSALDLAQIVVGHKVTDEGAVSFLKRALFDNKIPGQTVFFLNSATSLEHSKVLGGYEWEEGGVSSPLQQLLPWNWNNDKKAEVVATVKELWQRGDSDNVLFAVLVLVHEYVRSVPAVKSSAKGMDIQSLFCIMRHCFSQVQDCIQNPTCKTALDCLNACSFNDQVCQYRCIVSYETPQLGSFSLCILQLHNCRRLTSSPPPIPNPAPLATFQGKPLTHEAAEKVLRGWLGESSVSWMVSGGKNPAYDYFPCQHQLFFPGKAKGAYWYEPVFKVKTLDGGEVWRRRRYRVRRGKVPGTFHLTVLDNGVTSNEFWRLLDAADDLSYSLFYYSGAASAAGLSYTGAVLATPDGNPPAAEHLPRIEAALERAGIKSWELSSVDNSNCVGAPLTLSDEAVAAMAPFAAT